MDQYGQIGRVYSQIQLTDTLATTPTSFSRSRAEFTLQLEASKMKKQQELFPRRSTVLGDPQFNTAFVTSNWITGSIDRTTFQEFI